MIRRLLILLARLGLRRFNPPFEPLSLDEQTALDVALGIWRHHAKAARSISELPTEFTVPAWVFDGVESAFGHMPWRCLETGEMTNTNTRYVHTGEARPHLRFKGAVMLRGED